MKISCERLVEHDDGSGTYVFNLDHEALVAMAKIGLEKVLTESAEAVLNGDVDGLELPEGEADALRRSDGDTDVQGEVPGV